MKPHDPAPYDLGVIDAINAWKEGIANEGQQKAAYEWVVYVASLSEGMSYQPGGPEGDRASAFCEGRRFVGNSIKKMSNPITRQAAASATQLK